MKLVNSGVPEGVVQAYIQNSSSAFNLTADDIIQLQAARISSSLLAAMLNHDTDLRQNASVPPPPPNQPALPPPDQLQGATAAPPAYPLTMTDYGDAGAYYNDLAPYGNWTVLPDYGYCWQPSSTFWAVYPTWGFSWAWLDTGWWFCAGRGWCWFPRFHDRGFGANHSHGFGFPGRRPHDFDIRHGGQDGFAGRGGLAGGRSGHPSTGRGGNSFGAGNRGIGSPPVTAYHRFGGTGLVGGQNRFQTFGRVPTARQPMTMSRPLGGGPRVFSSPGRMTHSGGGFNGGRGRR